MSKHERSHRAAKRSRRHTHLAVEVRHFPLPVGEEGALDVAYDPSAPSQTVAYSMVVVAGVLVLVEGPGAVVALSYLGGRCGHCSM